MLTRREALFQLFRSLVAAGFLVIAWDYIKGIGNTLLKVSFSRAPAMNEVIFREEVYLVGLEKGPKALAARCPHLGCRVDYHPGLNRFRCPCHGSEFAIDGQKIKGPAKKDMTELDVRSDQLGGKCTVTLDIS